MRTAILIPAHRRPEYTRLCLKALEAAQDYSEDIFYLIDDGSNDQTISLFEEAKLPKVVIAHLEQKGLRNIIIEFFNQVSLCDYDYIAKIDNDCIVPKDWLNNLTNVLKTTDRDIVSPNVLPSNAAYFIGKEGDAYRESDYVGGLWCMKADLIRDIYFEPHSPNGIRGAFNLIKQIIIEKEAKCGWVHTVNVEDIGHWSGSHPLHIKSPEHEQYSVEVGRSVSWNA